MASKIVSLILQLKNKLSAPADDASKSLQRTKDRAVELEKSLAKFEGAQAAVDSLDDVKNSATKAEKAFDAAQLEVIRLKAELKTNKTPELALALDKAKISSAGAKKEWVATEKTVKKLEKTLQRAGVDIKDMAGSQVELTASLNKTKGALKANAQRIETLSKKTGEYSQEAKKSTVSVGGFITRAAGFLGVYTLINKVQGAFSAMSSSVYDSGIQFEKLGARLSDLELGYIEEFARDVPFQLQETAEAFAKLKTFGLDPMNGSLQAISDQTAKLGGGQEELNGIVTALGQAWGKQKLQQEEILQLIERGVPAWDLLSQATGKTTVELQKMSTAGQLGRKEIKLLIDAMGEASAGSAAKQMSTLAGLVSNLQDRFTQFARSVADAGVFDYLKEQATDLIAKFEELASNGQLDKIAKAIANTFIQGAEAVKSFVSTVTDLSGTFLLLGQAWLGLKVAGWYGTLSTAATGFFAVGKSADGASFSLRGLAGAAKAAMGAFVVQQIFNVVAAYKELGIEVNKLEASQRKQADTQNKLDARLKGISESAGVLVGTMAELERQIKAGNIVIDEQSNQYLNAEQAANLYMQRQSEVSDVIAKVVFDQDKLSESMKNTSEALKDATADNSKLAGVLNDQLLLALQGGNEGVLGFSLALRQAEQQSDLTSKQIDEGLVVALDKLSDQERARFGEQIKQAMLLAENSTDGAAKKIEYLQRLMDSLDESKMSASLKRLGIEQAQLTNEITLGVEQSLKDLTSLDQQLAAIGGSSDNSVVVFDAIKKAIAGIKTEADALALSGAMSDFRKQGAITYDQYEKLKNQIGELDAVAGRSSQWLADRMKMIGEGAEESGEKIKQMAEDVDAEVSGLSDSAGRAGQDIRSVASGLVGFFHGIKNSIYELSVEAGAAFDNKLGIDVQPVLDEIESLQAGIDSAYVRSASLVRDNALAFDATGINKFKNTVLEAQSSVEIAYNSQKIKFLEYTQAIESGENINKSFLNSAENSIKNMNLLGQEDLSRLRSALDSANQKLQQMSDSAASTLDGLKNELDSIQGNQDAIEKRDYERKKAELKGAIEDAQLYGNREAISSYNEALKVLDQVRKERQAQAKENANKASAPASSSSSAAENSNTSTTTINLNSTSGGKSVQLTGSDDAVAQLLDVLADANLRAG